MQTLQQQCWVFAVLHIHTAPRAAAESFSICFLFATFHTYELYASMHFIKLHASILYMNMYLPCHVMPYISKFPANGMLFKLFFRQFHIIFEFDYEDCNMSHQKEASMVLFCIL